jgi:hypothetical protein
MAHDVSTLANETAKITFKRPTDDTLASCSTFACNSGLDKLMRGGAEFGGEVKFNSVANPFTDGTNREILMLGGSNALARDASFTYNMLDNQLNTPKANISDTLTVNDVAAGGELVVTGNTSINTLSVTGTATFGDDCTITSSKDLKFQEANGYGR